MPFEEKGMVEGWTIDPFVPACGWTMSGHKCQLCKKIVHVFCASFDERFKASDNLVCILCSNLKKPSQPPSPIKVPSPQKQKMQESPKKKASSPKKKAAAATSKKPAAKKLAQIMKKATKQATKKKKATKPSTKKKKAASVAPKLTKTKKQKKLL